MDLFIGVLFLTGGLFAIFKPAVYYQKEKLTPAQIEKNNRLFKRGGIGLVIMSVALIIITLLA